MIRRSLIKMPLVIGVSATPKRFMDLLEHAPHTVHKVAIPPDEVRLSGLLKDRILIHHPESATTAEMALLEEAARRWAQMTAAWANYCKEEGEQPIWPVLVVQVDNATANAVKLLLQHPKVWQEICADPSLIPNAVEECLRHNGSVAAWRRLVTADTQGSVLQLQRLNEVREGREDSMQLWALDGDKPPRSLGVIASTYKTLQLPAPATALAGVQELAISVEDKGGAAEGRGPRLPYLFKGGLVKKAL